MKEKMKNALGGLGFVLFYVLTVIYAFAPLLVLDFPLIADILLIFVIVNLRSIGGVLCLALYIWAAVAVFTHPLNLASVIFIVCAVLYTVLCVIPGLRKLFGKHEED